MALKWNGLEMEQPPLFLYQADGVGGDALLAACEAEPFGGRGLDGDIVLVAATDLCHTGLHGRDVGIHLGALGADGGVDVHQTVAFCGNQGDGVAEDDLAVHAFGLCRGVGEVIADVAHIRCSQQGIADGVQQHVGIAVTQEALTVFDLDAAHPEVAAFH